MNSNPAVLPSAKHLAQEPPRKPDERFGGYVVLARTIDKGRACLAGTSGDYHFDCSLDQMLFEFKSITGDELLKVLGSGASDDEVLEWLDSHGINKTPEEIKAWSDQMETFSFYYVPEKKTWFVGECEWLGLDPTATTLFDYLEIDDRKSFGLPVPIQDRHP